MNNITSHSDDEIIKKHGRKNLIYVEFTYLDQKNEKKRCRFVLLGQKIT